MEIDEAVVQLTAKLDDWCDTNLSVFASRIPDRLAQSKALLAGIEMVKELDRLKARGLAALAALLKPQDAVGQEPYSRLYLRRQAVRYSL